jgi:hypothetical protein
MKLRTYFKKIKNEKKAIKYLIKKQVIAEKRHFGNAKRKCVLILTKNFISALKKM